MKRIESLRQKALTRDHDYTEFFYRFYKKYEDNTQASSAEERYGAAFYEAFSKLTPHITDGELIVGEIAGGLSAEEYAQWQEIYKPRALAFYRTIAVGQDSHMAIDYSLVLSRGIAGVLADVENYLLHCDDAQKPFYLACRASLLAVVRHAERYAELAAEMAQKEEDPTRREELLEIARICKKVPANPAESFYEAVQSVHFITYCLSLNPYRLYCFQQFQLGHPDRYLLPYYEKDIREGKITKERAQLLLDCLGIQINMRVPSGLSSGYMVGGRDENGALVANELTEMCMQVVDDIRLVYPSVGLCYTADMSDRYLEKACDILSHGRSHPAIFNDDIITKGLEAYGVPTSQAHDYIHSTCVEITPVASSNVWVASPYTNMAELLLNTMTREYESFDEHLSVLLENLDRSIQKNFEVQNRFRQLRAEKSMNPLLSCFVRDCLARGLDIENGGARYNWIMPSFVGMANLVDSLYALKRVVYEERRYTVCSLKEILDCDFRGHEDLRLHLLGELPKYGNDIDEIDGYVGRLVEHLISECQKHTAIHANANLIPSVFCWEMHERFGRATGATPDGRCAGFPLGDGSGPCQGRELNGPTASILSSTKWDHSKLIGGVAVNMKFSKQCMGKNSITTLMGLIKAFLLRGGFEMQINVIDRETLKDAMQHPEKYQSLTVRLYGFSEYFVSLPYWQQLAILNRTEYTP